MLCCAVQYCRQTSAPYKKKLQFECICIELTHISRRPHTADPSASSPTQSHPASSAAFASPVLVSSASMDLHSAEAVRMRVRSSSLVVYWGRSSVL